MSIRRTFTLAAVAAALAGGAASAASSATMRVPTGTDPTSLDGTTLVEPSDPSTTVPQCLSDGSVPEGAGSCVDDLLPDPLPGPSPTVPQCLPDRSLPEGAMRCRDPRPRIEARPPRAVPVPARPPFTG
jgi:hypothetical protein